MGNQLTRDYTVSENPVASGGPSFLWKIHGGVNKNTREDVSVFICHIKDIEARFGKEKTSQVIAQFRREAAVLNKLRHPLILTPIQPLIETRTDLVMITEPVLGSVSNLLLKRYTHITNVPHAMEKYELHDLEMKYGMCQVMEALAFCHQNAHIVHGNLTPHQIFVTPKGQWKLSGFHFSFHSKESIDGTQGAPNTMQPQTTIIPQELDEIIHFGTSINKSSFLPSLDYAAPEYVIDKKPGFSSDIFSLGLVYSQLLRANGRSTGCKADEGDDTAPSTNSSVKVNPSAPLLNTYQNLEKYNTAVKRLNEILSTEEPYITLPPEVLDSLRAGCSLSPNERPTAHFILSHCELFFGNEVRALRYLNNMEMREAVKKAQFLRSLLPMIKPTAKQEQQKTNELGFPDRILFQRVLPPLLDECKDVKMTLYALPNVLAISERMDNAQFAKMVLPTLCKYVLMYTDQQAKVPAMVLQHFDLLWAKSSPPEQKNFLIPFLVRCLQSSQHDVQIEAMKRSEEWLHENRLSYNEFKTLVLPDLQAICRKTSNQMVRINGIVCLGKVLPKLDKQVIVNVVVPVLEHALKTDPSNATTPLLMSCVGVFLKITKQFGQDPDLSQVNANLIASRILPAILPIATQKSMQLEPFKKYMKAVRSMLDIVENQKLDELERAERMVTNDSPTLSENGDSTTTSTNEDEYQPLASHTHDNIYSKPTLPSVPNTTVIDPLTRILMEKDEDEGMEPMQRRVINYDESVFVNKNDLPNNNNNNNNNNNTPKQVVVDQSEERNDRHFDNLLGRFMIDEPTTSIIRDTNTTSLFGNRKIKTDIEEKELDKKSINRIAPTKNVSTNLLTQESEYGRSMINHLSEITNNEPPLRTVPVLPSEPRTESLDNFDRMLDRMGNVDLDESPSHNLFGSKYQSEMTSISSRFDKKNDHTISSLLSNHDDLQDKTSTSMIVKTEPSTSVSLFDQIQGRFNSELINDDDHIDDTPKTTMITSNSSTKQSGNVDLFDSLLMRHVDSDDD
jgi:SCY1-like protein 2